MGICQSTTAGGQHAAANRETSVVATDAGLASAATVEEKDEFSDVATFDIPQYEIPLLQRELATGHREEVERLLDGEDASLDWLIAMPPHERQEWLEGLTPEMRALLLLYVADQPEVVLDLLVVRRVAVGHIPEDPMSEEEAAEYLAQWIGARRYDLAATLVTITVRQWGLKFLSSSLAPELLDQWFTYLSTQGVDEQRRLLGFERRQGLLYRAGMLGSSPAYQVAQLGVPTVVVDLLFDTIDGYTTSDAFSPLMRSILLADEAVTDVRHFKAADCIAEGEQGITPLLCAVARGHLPTVKAIVENVIGVEAGVIGAAAGPIMLDWSPVYELICRPDHLKRNVFHWIALGNQANKVKFLQHFLALDSIATQLDDDDQYGVSAVTMLRERCKQAAQSEQETMLFQSLAVMIVAGGDWAQLKRVFAEDAPAIIDDFLASGSPTLAAFERWVVPEMLAKPEHLNRQALQVVIEALEEKGRGAETLTRQLIGIRAVLPVIDMKAESAEVMGSLSSSLGDPGDVDPDFPGVDGNDQMDSTIWSDKEGALTIKWPDPEGTDGVVHHASPVMPVLQTLDSSNGAAASGFHP